MFGNCQGQYEFIPEKFYWRLEMDITKIQALRAVARVYETFSIEPIAEILADDFVFCSQLEIVDIASKDLYLDLLSENLEGAKASGNPLRTRIGYWGDEPCLAVVQDCDGINESTRFVKVSGDKITRLDFCFAPGPGDLSYR